LYDTQRAEISHKLWKLYPPSKWSIAKEYGLLSEYAVCPIMKNADVILEYVHHGSETENLENEDEVQESINSFPGWHALHHSFCELQNNLYNLMLLKLQVIHMKWWLMLLSNSKSFLEKSTASSKSGHINNLGSLLFKIASLI
jgi:hypothetical protein